MGLGWSDLGYAIPGYNSYKIYNDLQNSAAKGYNTASAGAQQAGAASQQFSQEQWDRQMQGLGGAMGQYNPAQGLWQSYYGTMAPTQPGAFESWYANNGGKLTDPTKTGGALDSYQQYMSGPMQAQSAYGNYASYMQQPSSTQGAFDYMNGQAGQGTLGQSAYGAQSQAFNNPGQGESWYGQNAARYSQPTNSQSLYSQAGTQLQGPGRSESWAPDMGRQNAIQGKQDALYSGLQSPGYLDQNSAEIGGYARGASDVTDYASRNLGQYETPGMYEQWAASTINGSNPELDRERQQGLAQINQEMARRGQFNSGGAGTAIGNYLAAENAKEFSAKSDLAQGAQQMQLARLGQGQGLAQGSASGKLAQGGALQSLYSQQDQNKLGRDNLSAQIASSQAGQDLSAQGLQLSANQAADNAQLQRLQGLSSLAGQADTSSLNQLNSGLNAAYGAQGLTQNRAMNNINAANSVDAQRQAQLNALMQGAGQNDATNLARYQAQYGMAQGLDQGAMQRYAQLGQLSGQYDQQNLANLLAQGNMAQNSQNDALARVQFDAQQKAQAFASQFGIDQNLAQLYGGFYGQGGQLSGQAFSDATNAYANAAGLKGQGQNAAAAVPWQLASLGIKAYGAAQTQTPDGGGGDGSYQALPTAFDMNTYLGGNQAGEDYARSGLNNYLDLNAGQGWSAGQLQQMMSNYYDANGLANPYRRSAGGGYV